MDRHIYMVLPFGHDDTQVIECHNQSVQWSLHESGPTGLTPRTWNIVEGESSADGAFRF